MDMIIIIYIIDFIYLTYVCLKGFFKSELEHSSFLFWLLQFSVFPRIVSLNTLHATPKLAFKSFFLGRARVFTIHYCITSSIVSVFGVIILICKEAKIDKYPNLRHNKLHMKSKFHTSVQCQLNERPVQTKQLYPNNEHREHRQLCDMYDFVFMCSVFMSQTLQS